MSISEPRVQVVDEPGKALLKAYVQWAFSVQHQYGRDKILEFSNGSTLETEIYNSALRFPAPVATERDINAFVGEAQSGTPKTEAADAVPNKIFGYFISALINRSSVDRIECELKPRQDGARGYSAAYRLPPGKTFILKKGSMISALGTYAGGHIINEGNVELMGHEAQGGTRVNKGTARMIQSKSGIDLNFGLAEFMDDGQFQLNYGKIEKRTDEPYLGVFGYRGARRDDIVRINFGEAVDQAMGLGGAGTSVEINEGKLWTFGKGARDVFLLNNGEVASMEVYGISSGVSALNRGIISVTTEQERNNPEYWDLGRINRGRWPQRPAQGVLKRLFGSETEDKLKLHAQGLDMILKELKNIGKNPTEEQLLKYDWGRAQGKILDLAKKIKEVMRQAA